MRHNSESQKDELRYKLAAAEIERTSAFQRGHAAASAEKDKEITRLQAEVARLKAALEKLIAACNAGRTVQRGGVTGMTIDAQLRNSVINGVWAYSVLEAEEELAALKETSNDA